jgi:hypothetical protein
MVRQTVRASLFLIAAALGSLGVAGNSFAAQQPAIEIGDAWVYETTDRSTGEKRGKFRQVVTEVGDNIVIRIGKSELVYTREMNLIEVRSGGATTAKFDPYRLSYSFPLDTGKRYEKSFAGTSRSGARTTRYQSKAQVVGTESVTTAAGTFDAIKVVIEGTFDADEGVRRWSGSRTETLWYAPAVKRHVRSEFEERWRVSDITSGSSEVSELISFTPAKKP